MNAIEHIKSLNLSKAVIIGKGQSSTLFDQSKYSEWVIITINDASKLASGENVYNHFIDYEALKRSRITGKIITPIYMHINEKPSNKPITDEFSTHLLYSLSTKPVNHLPLIEVRSRSSEACLDLCAKSGINTVHFYGVNGGLTYAADFQNIPRLKENESHDIQFRFLQELTRKHRLNVTYM